ncbi:hypothetical protein ACOMHN_056055 [Nucella lapillus]
MPFAIYLLCPCGGSSCPWRGLSVVPSALSGSARVGKHNIHHVSRSPPSFSVTDLFSLFFQPLDGRRPFFKVFLLLVAFSLFRVVFELHALAMPPSMASVVDETFTERTG